ncbi:MAG: DNA repair protein RecN [Bacteroidales bacterium]|nr:DNA repair protein RecN [Bacteroidales bacterium]MCM1415498.1 DNA repair protein RecN [bacterium]MCM1423435.1 DNA repair protein RecN [bacterium]
MLESLHVKNLALIDEAEVLFGKGLNILTGETGAGKSIIIGSINLALGAKADRELIRTGAEYALVELVFSVEEPAQRQMIEALELPLEENQVILQRKIMENRSVCKVCGETVTAKQLKQLAEILIDIHGQHEHQSLLKNSRQMEILDAYAGDGLAEKKEALKEVYRQYREAARALSENETDEETRRKECALAEFECSEIEEAALVSGEDEELEKTYQKMNNARKIEEAAAAAHALCGYENDGAGSAIGRALKEIRSVSAFDESLREYEQQLLDIDSLLNDYNRGMAAYVAGLAFDGQAFEQIQTRLNLINHLKAKYGNSVEEILKYQAKAQGIIEKYRDYDAYREKLAAKVEESREKALLLCAEISALRKKNADALAKQMQRALLDLNFEQAVFEIRVEGGEEHLGENGYDEVCFMISANPGEPLKELAQTASGGELSRIMLALKTVLADKDEIETLIFDEIDTGISGRTAWKVSEKMGILGKNHQLICITHLPQIAAMADSHFVIEKQVAEGRSLSGIRELSREESVRELARMLGGDQITDAALQNAEEMKELAGKTRQS